MSEDLLPDLFRALELFAIERRPDSSIVAITAPPSWLTPILDPSRDAAFHVGEAFPFLENFLRDAEVFWNAGTSGRLVSAAFSADSGGFDVVLRATALNLGNRCVMVLEPLHGDADTRPLLQKARENKLEYERLARRIESVQAALSTISKIATDLGATGLTDTQRELAERIGTASRRAQNVAAGTEPPERTR
jgi:hypothetical protein